MEQFKKAYKNVINELGKPDHKKDESDKEENANNKKFPETNKFIYC